MRLDLPAGLAASIGGLLAPFESLQREQRLDAQALHSPEGLPSKRLDFMWSTGHQPFGPFSNTSGISQLQVDVAHRHAVLTRLHVAARRLRAAARRIEQVIRSPHTCLFPHLCGYRIHP